MGGCARTASMATWTAENHSSSIPPRKLHTRRVLPSSMRRVGSMRCQLCRLNEASVPRRGPRQRKWESSRLGACLLRSSSSRGLSPRLRHTSQDRLPAERGELGDGAPRHGELRRQRGRHRLLAPHVSVRQKREAVPRRGPSACVAEHAPALRVCGSSPQDPEHSRYTRSSRRASPRSAPIHSAGGGAVGSAASAARTLRAASSPDSCAAAASHAPKSAAASPPGSARVRAPRR